MVNEKQTSKKPPVGTVNNQTKKS